MNTASLLTTADSSIKTWQDKIDRITLTKNFIIDHRETLERFSGHSTIFDCQIDFDYVDRETLLEIIRAFPGKWDKNFNEHSGGIDYQIQFQGITLRCWGAKPPPSCKIIREEIEVPAQIVPETIIPATTKVITRIDCSGVTEEDKELV